MPARKKPTQPEIPFDSGTDAKPRDAERELARFREEAADCKRCPLWKRGTQTVFGEGPATADLMLVGEQPGDQEDLAGHPFVGPAGRVLDKALNEAGIDRSQVYTTNAVKHFKWIPRGEVGADRKSVV